MRHRSVRAWLGALCLPLGLVSFGVQAALAPFENVRGYYQSITHDKQVRTALYLAPKQAPSERVPLLILLHYLDGESEPMANLTAPGLLVRDHGIYAIVPQALASGWGHNPADQRAADDMGFLLRLIDDAVANLPVDPHRVYLAGYSDGGNMVSRFVCEKPERIAAAALVSATMRKSLKRVCSPALPVPMLLMHGTADQFVTYDGRSTPYVNPLLGNQNLSAPDNAAYWARNNGCSPTPLQADLPDLIKEQTTVRLDRYEDCSSGAGVDFYTVNGGGHTWPGALDVSSPLGLTTQDLSATLTLWSFLSRFSRPD